MKLKNIQTIIQIFSELPKADALGKANIGGGKDTNIYPSLPGLAQSADGLLFQYTKQPGLKNDGQAGDFIQQESSA